MDLVFDGSPLHRFAHAIRAVAFFHSDVRTVGEWARIAGVSRSSLHTLALIVGTPAKSALDFARLLRVARTGSHTQRPIAWELHSADPRTVVRLLHRAGVSRPEPLARPETFVYQQALVDNKWLLDCVAKALITDTPRSSPDRPHA